MDINDAKRVISGLNDLKIRLIESPLFNAEIDTVTDSKNSKRIIKKITSNPDVFKIFKQAYDYTNQSFEKLWDGLLTDRLNISPEKVDYLKLVLKQLEQIQYFLTTDEKILLAFYERIPEAAYRNAGLDLVGNFLADLDAAKQKVQACESDAITAMFNVLVGAIQTKFADLDNPAASFIEQNDLFLLKELAQKIVKYPGQTFSERFAEFARFSDENKNKDLFNQVVDEFSKDDVSLIQETLQAEEPYTRLLSEYNDLDGKSSNAALLNEFKLKVETSFYIKGVLNKIAQGRQNHDAQDPDKNKQNDEILPLDEIQNYFNTLPADLNLQSALQMTADRASLLRLKKILTGASGTIDKKLAENKQQIGEQKKPLQSLRSPDVITEVVALSIDASSVSSFNDRIFNATRDVFLPRLLAKQQAELSSEGTTPRLESIIEQARASFVKQYKEQKEKLQKSMEYDNNDKTGFAALDAIVEKLEKEVADKEGSNTKDEQKGPYTKVVEGFAKAIKEAKIRHFYEDDENGSKKLDFNKLNKDSIDKFYQECCGEISKSAIAYGNAGPVMTKIVDTLKAALANWCIKILTAGYQPNFFARDKFPTAEATEAVGKIQGKMKEAIKELAAPDESVLGNNAAQPA